MDYELEHLVTKGADESTPSYEPPYVHVRSFKLNVEFYIAYPAPKNFVNRWFFRSFRKVEGIITVPEEATVESALQKATHAFPKSYPEVDFTRAVVFHRRRERHIAVLDRLANAGKIFDAREPMIILNDLDYFEKQGWQVARWVFVVLVCLVLLVTTLVLTFGS